MKLSEQKKRKKTIKQNLEITNPSQDQLSSLLEHYQNGRFNDAEKLAVSITQEFPKHQFAWMVLGGLFSATGRKSEALDACQTVVALSSQDALAHSNLGVVLQELGRIEEAEASYNQAIALKPDYAEAHSNLGATLQKLGRLDEAEASYNQAIALKPDYVEAHSNLGVTLKELGRLDEAQVSYNQAIALKPDYAEAHNNLGVTLQKLGRLDKAEASYNQAIALKPNYSEAHYNLGNILQELGKLEKAEVSYNQVIALNPNYAEAHCNLGVTLQQLGRLNESEASCNQAIALKPDYAEAFNNMGVNLQDQGKHDEAIGAYNKAISLQPDYAEAHLNLSFTLLNSDKLQEGLNENEWRWKTKKFLSIQRHFLQPLWDGTQSLKDKKILIWSEQGVGDTINWSSLLPLITHQAKHCILECQNKLVPLLQRSFPNVEVKCEDRSLDMYRDDFDYHLPMGSLNRHFLSEITQNTKPKAYLVPDPDRVNYWRERLNSLGKGPYVGIGWKSSNMSSERLPNYSSISEWSQILTIPNITFINLQSKNFADDLIKVQNEIGVKINNFDDLDQFNNIADVAALCTALDMVVSNHGTLPLISVGVGTLTKLANWRQSSWNNILNNPVGSSVDIFERDTLEPWDNVFRLIKEDILNITKIWSL